MHNINIYYTGISLIRNLCCLNVLSDRTAEHQLNHVNSLFKRLCCRKPFIRLVDIGIWPICISIWKSYSSNGHIVSKQNIAYLSNNEKLFVRSQVYFTGLAYFCFIQVQQVEDILFITVLFICNN